MKAGGATCRCGHKIGKHGEQRCSVRITQGSVKPDPIGSRVEPYPYPRTPNGDVGGWQGGLLDRILRGREDPR